MAAEQMYAWVVVSGEFQRFHCMSMDAAVANDCVGMLHEAGLEDAASVQVMVVDSAPEFLSNVAQGVERL